MNATPLSTITQWAKGRWISGNPDTLVTNVCTDSRALKAGDLFVALSGENFDGHAFVQEAARLGACGAIVSTVPAGLPAHFAVITVTDPVQALQSLAGAYRDTLAMRVFCITGSNGKTSTKDLTASVLSQRLRVTKTLGNLNNHLGLPLTLLRADSTHEAGVFEIGMNHPGEIAPLAALARPDVAIITNVGTAHIEFMGTRDAIALEKGMLAEAVAESGTVILCADDDFTPTIARRTRAKVVTAGLSGGDVRATDLEPLSTGTKFRLHTTGQCVEAELPVPGEHMVRNALLACAAGLSAGLTLAECAAGLRSIELTRGRLTQIHIRGIHLIDDTYNANPDSMSAALNTLARMPITGRRIAVLGRMGELGHEAERGHRSVGETAGREHIGTLIAVGEEARWIAEAAEAAGVSQVLRVANSEEATTTLLGLACPGDAVLVKGSRSARMERIVQDFQKGGSV